MYNQTNEVVGKSAATPMLPRITEEVHEQIMHLFGKMSSLRQKVNKIGGTIPTPGEDAGNKQLNPDNVADHMQSAVRRLESLNKEFEEQIIRPVAISVNISLCVITVSV